MDEAIGRVQSVKLQIEERLEKRLRRLRAKSLGNPFPDEEDTGVHHAYLPPIPPLPAPAMAGVRREDDDHDTSDGERLSESDLVTLTDDDEAITPVVPPPWPVAPSPPHVPPSGRPLSRPERPTPPPLPSDVPRPRRDPRRDD